MRSIFRAKSNSLMGFFYALAGTVFISTSYVTAKYALEGFNPETFSLVWMSAATVFSLAINLATGHRRQMRVPAAAVSKVMLMGLMTGAGIILGSLGLSRLDPSFAAFLGRLTPVLTILLSAIILGERFKAKQIVPILIMVLGSSLSTIGRWHIVGTGTLLVLVSNSTVATQMLLSKIMVTEISPSVLVFYRVAIAMLVAGVWAAIAGNLTLDVPRSYWLVTLLGAFLGPCTSFFFTFRSYRHWDLSRSSVVGTAQPLIVLPLAFLFLGRLPAEKELLGGCVLLLGAFWLTWIHFTEK